MIFLTIPFPRELIRTNDNRPFLYTETWWLPEMERTRGLGRARLDSHSYDIPLLLPTFKDGTKRISILTLFSLYLKSRSAQLQRILQVSDLGDADHRLSQQPKTHDDCDLNHWSTGAEDECDYSIKNVTKK